MAEYPPISELVPHSGPMVLLDAMRAWAPGEATCTMRVREGMPFVKGELFDAVALMEPMAQAVAACLGYEAFQGGEGVRVYLDTQKLENWPEIRDWYLKRKKKQDQDFEGLLAQIKEAGHRLLGVQRVRVEPEKIRRKKMGPVGLCPVCGEAYPANDGERCRNCRGETPYTQIADIETA